MTPRVMAVTTQRGIPRATRLSAMSPQALAKPRSIEVTCIERGRVRLSVRVNPDVNQPERLLSDSVVRGCLRDISP